MLFDRRREFDALGGGQHAEDCADEYELTDFHADIETEQRERNIALGQADVDQRAGEAKAVQQAEGKGDDPWPPRGQAWLAAPQSYDLASEQDDAQRDRGLDRRSRYVHDPEGRQAQSDRMSERERGDGPQENAPVAHDQNQGENEQQMVEAEQNMLDAVGQIGCRDRQGPLRRSDV